jgi:UMF1 family MFS transporter
VRVRKGTVVAWSLYELGATSFAMNLLSLHLPLDIAGRVPRGSEKFSLAFGLSMAVVAVTAPFLGRLADRAGKRRFLVPFVLAGVAFTALVAAPGPVPRVLALFALANIAFQCAYVFYNALLPDVSDETNSGRVSGFGVAAGYLGSLLGMFLVLPFVSGAIRLQMPHVLLPVIDALSVASLSSNVNDAWVRRNAYLPTALLWLVAAVPLLFFARLPKTGVSGTAARAPGIGENEEKEISANAKEGAGGGGAAGVAEAFHNANLPSKKSHSPSPLRDVVNTVRSLPETPSLLWFLVSNFLYIDVIHTIQIQMSTYSRYAVGLNDAQVQILLLVATAVAILGGLLYGLLCQRVTIRTATLVALGNWALVFALALLVRDPKAFTVVGVLAGIGLGGIKVTGRLGVITLVPKERMTEFFGFFTLAGEAASVLGPFLWAATLTLFPDKSPAGYRAGISVLFLVLAFAIGAFLKVRFPEKEDPRPPRLRPGGEGGGTADCFER